MTSQNNDLDNDMNTRPSPSKMIHDPRSELITDVVLTTPIRTAYVFDYLFALKQVSVVAMNVGVDGAPFASVCAMKAATGQSLPMFGPGAGVSVNLLTGGLDNDLDADALALHQVLFDEELTHCDPSQWPGSLRIQKQFKDASALYLNTKIGFLTFYRRLVPNSLIVIYDLTVWLRSEGLTVETASELLAKLNRACSEKGVTFVIFERHSPDNNTLAGAIGSASEVLQLVPDQKAPTQTGSGCLLLRKNRGIFDIAPVACSFWISTTDAGGLVWGMEPRDGHPSQSSKELNAMQRRILTKQWITRERTPRQIAVLLGLDPSDVPENIDQKGMAKMLGTSESTVSRYATAIKKELGKA